VCTRAPPRDAVVLPQIPAALVRLDYPALVAYGQQSDEQRVVAALELFRRREAKLLRRGRVRPRDGD
jgi:hypothetical protein